MAVDGKHPPHDDDLGGHTAQHFSLSPFLSAHVQQRPSNEQNPGFWSGFEMSPKIL